ncbi:MAG: hypothetical protein IAE99_00565 [Rhodothermales bacterium]|nr:hypothetical protein [Rhodothermales bacterium]
MTDAADVPSEALPPPLPVHDRSTDQSQTLFRVAAVLGPLAALLGASASQLAALRGPSVLATPPLQTFVVLVNLFFCLPYLAAFAFAFTARTPDARAHRHAVAFAALVFGALMMAVLMVFFDAT